MIFQDDNEYQLHKFQMDDSRGKCIDPLLLF
jgi:hypothetical protein